MSTLHTVNKSPFSTQTLLSCLNHAKDGDAVLMIEDGVYGGAKGTGLADVVSAKARTWRVVSLWKSHRRPWLQQGRRRAQRRTS